MNKFLILKTRNKKLIKIIESKNCTFVDFENKVSKLPFNLLKTLEFFKKLEII
nr:hypothetical protein [Fusobacterium gastrosuis]